MTKHKPRLIAENPINTLGKMLQTKRPANTYAVYDFIDEYLTPLGATIDHAGNAIIRVGTDSRVLWSSHTDTVHRNEGLQRVSVNGDLFKLAYGEKSNCLGADCTTGIWLMREMIIGGINGTYVFHADEEIGGYGSAWLAKNHGGLLDGIDFAIAFDRKGFNSVITHQFGGRCASDKFAYSLSSMLPNLYETDDTGTFTDTANYTGIIGECTNVSVGYLSQHTDKETQSISHALVLRNAMLSFDETKLIKSRNAGDIDHEMPSYHHYAWNKPKNSYAKKSYGSFYDMVDFITDNPEAVADMLDQYGITYSDLLDHVEGSYKG
jgi:hypothetical protein